MDCLALYQSGVEQLKTNSIADAEFESSLLLAFILGISRSSVLLNSTICSEADAQLFDSYIKRRCNLEPFAYITGHQEFWSLDFKVTPDVLIPRPETELIIEQVCHYFADTDFAGHILDCGTGSGILPVTLATIYRNVAFTALDVSEKALAVALDNSTRHHVEDRISFLQADFMGSLQFDQPFDIIVTNPPYVDAETFATLQRDVVGFEPHLALDGGQDGFVMVDHLLRSLGCHLRDGGHLFMEIGYDQEQRAMEVLRSLPFYGQYNVIKDYAGLPRMVHAVKVC